MGRRVAIAEPRPAREGYTYLVAPDGVASCSVAGVEYRVDDQGAVQVPAAAVAALLEHGFSVPAAESDG